MLKPAFPRNCHSERSEESRLLKLETLRVAQGDRKKGCSMAYPSFCQAELGAQVRSQAGAWERGEN